MQQLQLWDIFYISHMKRRDIIKKGAITTATAATIVSCSSGGNTTATGASLPTVRWKMATSWP